MSTFPTTQPNTASRRDRLIAASGVLVEWYDFIVYALLVTTLQKVFFPVSNEQLGLILAFTTFAIGYLARPLGGLVIGRLGDLRGRRFALTLATALMLIPLLVVTTLPTYEQIGIAAPLLLTLMRLLQGFSVGGQFTGALTTLSESAVPNQRSRSVSLGLATATGGILVASLVVLVTTELFGKVGLEAGAWRIPFAIGLVACTAAVIAQRRLQETHDFESARNAGYLGTPLKQILKHYPKSFVSIIVLSAWSAVTIYTLVTWLPSYLETVVGVSDVVAQGATALASAIYILAILPLARASDRFGRRRMMLLTALSYLLFSIPAVLLLDYGAVFSVAIAIIVLAVMQASLDSSATTEMTVLVPTNVRYTAMGVGYSIGAIIGSFTPALEESAVAATQSALVPGVILIGITLIAMPVVLFSPRIRESS